MANFNPLGIVDENIDEVMVNKAILYLLECEMIIGSDVINDNWTASITAKGIDWVEEFFVHTFYLQFL